MPDERLSLIISGRVQGVSFRASTVETAQKLGLQGYACNLADGRVEVVAEGPAQALIALEQWCHKGPPAAKVTDVDSEKSSATGEFHRFQVR